MDLLASHSAAVASMVLAVFGPLLAAPAGAAELTSASFIARGGHVHAGGSGALTSTAPQPSFAGAGSALGQSEAIGMSGSGSSLTTSASGFWPIVGGALPSLDTDMDGQQAFLDPDDDNDGLDDEVETNTGVFVSSSDTGSSPVNPNSDGDAFADGPEVAFGTDPNDRDSFPSAAQLPALPPAAAGAAALLIALFGALALARGGRAGVAGLLLPALLLLAPARAAVPGQVNFQGLLLDDQGATITGPASFDFSLFDVATGGSALWTESHPGISVLDGVYDVSLGSTTPLTPALLAGGNLYLEIVVDGETLAPRQRLLAVPFALQAASADAVDGLSAVFVTELFQHFNADGGGPANDDPSEGLGDTDADGIANFIDPDNDGDAISDIDEVAQGSDINLITPAVDSVLPTLGEASTTSTVLVQGTSFEAGMGVVFGSEAPTPQNLTATSFQVDVGPQPVGFVDVSVTRSNGESDTASAIFEFASLQPVIDSVVPNIVEFTATTAVTVTGQGFAGGMLVTVGSETPTPFSLTPTSFQVNVGPQPVGSTTLQVSYPSGNSDSEPFYFIDTSQPTKTVFLTSQSYIGSLGGLTGADAKCNARAAAASLPGTYMAWLADASDAPSTRFTQSPGPYVLTDGQLVATNYADLVDGQLAIPISMDENQFETPPTIAWSNVATSGAVGATAATTHCQGWTLGMSSGSGRFGSTGATNSAWTFNGANPCNFSTRLYCFEQ